MSLKAKRTSSFL